MDLAHHTFTIGFKSGQIMATAQTEFLKKILSKEISLGTMIGHIIF